MNGASNVVTFVRRVWNYAAVQTTFTACVGPLLLRLFTHDSPSKNQLGLHNTTNYTSMKKQKKNKTLVFYFITENNL